MTFTQTKITQTLKIDKIKQDRYQKQTKTKLQIFDTMSTIFYFRQFVGRYFDDVINDNYSPKIVEINHQTNIFD